MGQPGLEPETNGLRVQGFAAKKPKKRASSRERPTRDDEMQRDTRPVGQSWGNPVEAALARALDVATAAGRLDVVALLAEELKVRRLSR